MSVIAARPQPSAVKKAPVTPEKKAEASPARLGALGDHLIVVASPAAARVSYRQAPTDPHPPVAQTRGASSQTKTWSSETKQGPRALVHFNDGPAAILESDFAALDKAAKAGTPLSEAVKALAIPLWGIPAEDRATAASAHVQFVLQSVCNTFDEATSAAVLKRFVNEALDPADLATFVGLLPALRPQAQSEAACSQARSMTHALLGGLDSLDPLVSWLQRVALYTKGPEHVPAARAMFHCGLKLLIASSNVPQRQWIGRVATCAQQFSTSAVLALGQAMEDWRTPDAPMRRVAKEVFSSLTRATLPSPFHLWLLLGMIQGKDGPPLDVGRERLLADRLAGLQETCDFHRCFSASHWEVHEAVAALERDCELLEPGARLQYVQARGEDAKSATRKVEASKPSAYDLAFRTRAYNELVAAGIQLQLAYRGGEGWLAQQCTLWRKYAVHSHGAPISGGNIRFLLESGFELLKDYWGQFLPDKRPLNVLVTPVVRYFLLGAKMQPTEFDHYLGFALSHHDAGYRQVLIDELVLLPWEGSARDDQLARHLLPPADELPLAPKEAEAVRKRAAERIDHGLLLVKLLQDKPEAIGAAVVKHGAAAAPETLFGVAAGLRHLGAVNFNTSTDPLAWKDDAWRQAVVQCFSGLRGDGRRIEFFGLGLAYTSGIFTISAITTLGTKVAATVRDISAWNAVAATSMCSSISTSPELKKQLSGLRESAAPMVADLTPGGPAPQRSTPSAPPAKTDA